MSSQEAEEELRYKGVRRSVYLPSERLPIPMVERLPEGVVNWLRFVIFAKESYIYSRPAKKEGFLELAEDFTSVDPDGTRKIAVPVTDTRRRSLLERIASGIPREATKEMVPDPLQVKRWGLERKAYKGGGLSSSEEAELDAIREFGLRVQFRGHTDRLVGLALRENLGQELSIEDQAVLKAFRMFPYSIELATLQAKAIMGKLNPEEIEIRDILQSIYSTSFDGRSLRVKYLPRLYEIFDELLAKKKQNEERTASLNSQEFVRKKRAFFFGLIRDVDKKAWLLHVFGGLREKSNGKREWRNVTDHQLVVLARCMKMGRLLGLDTEILTDLGTAAACHDFSKAMEKQYKAQDQHGGISWSEYREVVSKPSEEAMRRYGIAERAITISGSVGHEAIQTMATILTKKDGEVTQEDLAKMIIFYIDNYTTGSDWVRPMEMLDDRPVNAMTARINKNISNPKLQNLNKLVGLSETERAFFGRKNMSQVQLEVGRSIEDRLARMLSQKLGVNVDPISLPEFIDNKLIEEIGLYPPATYG
ncbi:MAG: hypothetical protein US96_C0002G0028 [Candidatus Woesebacteria bacterium GW2011_GWB1_38_5b]|uniref:HD domain-containing protein n=1 Tax=Candidatus Woesebacteria bacterium GW2011_GWB1_38_5b TaxID=1618569 RepID=A0A0G0KK84_9BACT|nr:MAG: hypothetical protein US96_C0002G0028 [Candidatus Woesebacteria bacterium GW2011_GWB1_38_5b]